MSVPTIVAVVEGHGEVGAVPILLRRISETSYPDRKLHTPSPIRLPASKMKQNNGELERSVQLAAAKAGSHGAVFILVDADDDCPAELGPRLLGRARSARDDILVAVVVAKWEYESWFISAAHSLRGVSGLPADLERPASPETIQGAKEWIATRSGRKYVETIDQSRLTARFAIEEAREHSDSFDKLHREVERMLAMIYR